MADKNTENVSSVPGLSTPDQNMALVWMCNSLYGGATLPQKVTHEFVLLLKETAAK